MYTDEIFVTLPLSERSPIPNSTMIDEVNPDEIIVVTVRVRRMNELPPLEEMALLRPADRQYLTHEAYEQKHGASADDLDKVAVFARLYGLTVKEQSSNRRSIKLLGTVQAFRDVFQVTLHKYEHSGETYRGRTGNINIPKSLEGIVEAVFGLDNRPFARPHRCRRPSMAMAVTAVEGQAAKRVTFTPLELANIYNFPESVDGTGETIGIIELGGDYTESDLDAYFESQNIRKPSVKRVIVGGPRSEPASLTDEANNEVLLDIEVAGSIAPGANIVVYLTTHGTDQEFLDALTTAINDKENRPSIISISWGASESACSAAFLYQFQEALKAAATLGITVCAAAGDNGAADSLAKLWDGTPHVDFPSASPLVLSCGGTSLVAEGKSIVSEVVWNQRCIDQETQSFGSTGGGISQVFRAPQYQQNIVLPVDTTGSSIIGRAVPDVAAVADPMTGYDIFVNGKVFCGMGGTSAAAPLWAGLIARINQKLGTRAGFINALLYTHPMSSQAFNSVTTGDNRVGDKKIGYDAGPAWDACTGLGTPDGVKIFELLSQVAATN